MLEIPDYVPNGLVLLYEEDPVQKEIDRFATRWGGFDQEALAQALSHGEEQERLEAICILGASGFPGVHALLLPYLKSGYPKERWLSAIVLGRLKEAEALPALVNMLTEYVPTEQSPTLLEDQLQLEFDGLRCDVANALALWEDRSLLAAFRQAYIATIQATKYAPQKHGCIHSWHIFQEFLMDTAGRWEAFGILTGVALPELHLRLAMVHMARGWCRLGNRPDIVTLRILFQWLTHPEVRRDLKLVLGHRFGLSDEEQNRVLDSYIDDYLDRDNPAYYG